MASGASHGGGAMRERITEDLARRTTHEPVPEPEPPGGSWLTSAGHA